MCCCTLPLRSKFQFTPLREGRLRAPVSGCVNIKFQFTPLREGRHRGTRRHKREYQFQFTPLREGRPGVDLSDVVMNYISIHAPAGGATAVLDGGELVNNISIHAPAGGATRDSVACVSCGLFQFTPLREGRPRPRLAYTLTPNFNSRPCGRGDAYKLTPKLHRSYFNSRPCGRGDATKWPF